MPFEENKILINMQELRALTRTHWGSSQCIPRPLAVGEEIHLTTNPTLFASNFRTEAALPLPQY